MEIVRSIWDFYVYFISYKPIESTVILFMAYVLLSIVMKVTGFMYRSWYGFLISLILFVAFFGIIAYYNHYLM